MLISYANNAQANGVVGELQEIIKETRLSLEEKYKKLKSSNAIEYKPTASMLQTSRVHPLFASSILLHTSERYQKMMLLNPCYFYSLLDSSVLKNSFGSIDYILLIMKGLEGKEREVLVPTKKYTSVTYQYKCKNNAELSSLFTKDNLAKTITSLKFDIPESQKQCSNILAQWKKNPYLPYLCKVPQQIENGERSEKLLQRKDIPLTQLRKLKIKQRSREYLVKNISYLKRSYLKNLCDGVADQQTFCEPYLAKDAWSKIINGEINQDYLKYSCLEFNKKKMSDPLSKKQLRTCANIFRKSPKVCTSLTSKGLNDLNPKPNCRALSQALNISRLKAPFRDCPEILATPALTNIHRIGQHFSLDFHITKDNNIKNCDTYAYQSLANIYIENKDKERWPLHLCYFDKIDNKEVCKFYIPGSSLVGAYREEKVVSDILYRLGKIGKKTTCQLTPRSLYKPVFIRFKSGCHIIKNDNDCLGNTCKRSILINEKVDNSIEYRGEMLFDYFPLQWKNQRYSVASLLTDRYKLKSKKILNLTQLERFLKNKPDGIIHGMACIEDILPKFYTRQRLNTCQPIPFIISGVLENNQNKMLSVRTALDSIHNPRLIFWNFVFTGIMNYQNQHPLNTWTLYGLSK